MIEGIRMLRLLCGWGQAGCLVAALSGLSPVRAQPALPATKLVSQSALRSMSFRLQADPETFDWHKAHTPAESSILENIMEGLVSLEDPLHPSLALAQRTQISPDAKTYIFTLRPNIRWSDGVSLRAQDFIAGWKRLLAPLTAAPNANIFFDVVNARAFNQGKVPFGEVGLRALDDHQLEIRLERPIHQWIARLGFWASFPMRLDLVERFGAEWAMPGRMATLGPYRLIVHETDTKCVLIRNPNYYRTMGNLDQITGLVIPSDEKALKLFDKGEVDFVGDLSSLSATQLDAKSQKRSFSHFKTHYLSFVVEQAPLDLSVVRRAISRSLRRSELREILSRTTTPASSLIPPGLEGFDQAMGLAFAPDQAREDLRKAGVDLDLPLRLRLGIPTWSKALAVAEWVKTSLKNNLNLELVIEPLEYRQYRERWERLGFPMTLGSWVADRADQENFLSIFTPESGHNRTGWRDTLYDQLIQTGRAAPSSSGRLRAYAAAQRRLIEEEAVVIPLYYEDNLALLSPRLRQVGLNALDSLFLREGRIVP